MDYLTTLLVTAALFLGGIIIVFLYNTAFKKATQSPKMVFDSVYQADGSLGSDFINELISMIHHYQRATAEFDPNQPCWFSVRNVEILGVSFSSYECHFAPDKTWYVSLFKKGVDQHTEGFIVFFDGKMEDQINCLGHLHISPKVGSVEFRSTMQTDKISQQHCRLSVLVPVIDNPALSYQATLHAFNLADLAHSASQYMWDTDKDICKPLGLDVNIYTDKFGIDCFETAQVFEAL